MDMLKGLPEPVKAGLMGASLGAGVAMVMSEQVSTISFAVSQGVLAAAAAYVAPQALSDPMQQVLGAGAIGAGAGYALGDYVPGGPIVSGAIAGGSLQLARMAM
jgi:hypothetical protein